MSKATLRDLLSAKAGEWKVPVPEDWKEQLNHYQTEYNIELGEIDRNHFLSASLVGIRKSKQKIQFNYEWALHLLLKKDPSIHKTFLVTLGHERTHGKGDWNPKFKSPIRFIRKLKNIRFVLWLNEVHADMGSSVEFPELTRKDIIHACWYKVNVKFDNNLRDKEDMSHPSWARRIYYVQKYNFDEQLIRKIAADTGCEYVPLINRAIDEIPEIHLK